MTLRPISGGFEIVTWFAVAVFIVTLLACSPTAPAAAPTGLVLPSGPSGDAGATTAPEAIDAAALYRRHCAVCHGTDGSGAVGPRIARRVGVDQLDRAAEIAVVSAGRLGMPSFGPTLSAEEITAIVDYTRTILGT